MGNQLGSEILDASPKKTKEVGGYRVKTIPTVTLPDEYHNIVFANFLNSLRNGNDYIKLIDREDYYKHYSLYITMLLQRPTARLTLGLLDDGTVLGWSLHEGNVLHYVWVKKEVRRHGIAKELVPKSFNIITHFTNKGLNIWANKLPHVRLNPFI